MRYDMTPKELRALAEIIESLPDEVTDHVAWMDFEGDILLGDIPLVMVGGGSDPVGWIVWSDDVGGGGGGGWAYRAAGDKTTDEGRLP